MKKNSVAHKDLDSFFHCNDSFSSFRDQFKSLMEGTYIIGLYYPFYLLKPEEYFLLLKYFLCKSKSITPSEIYVASADDLAALLNEEKESPVILRYAEVLNEWMPSKGIDYDFYSNHFQGIIAEKDKNKLNLVDKELCVELEPDGSYGTAAVVTNNRNPVSTVPMNISEWSWFCSPK